MASFQKKDSDMSAAVFSNLLTTLSQLYATYLPMYAFQCPTILNIYSSSPANQLDWLFSPFVLVLHFFFFFFFTNLLLFLFHPIILSMNSDHHLLLYLPQLICSQNDSLQIEDPQSPSYTQRNGGSKMTQAIAGLRSELRSQFV